jgi:hypothetical protein
LRLLGKRYGGAMTGDTIYNAGGYYILGWVGFTMSADSPRPAGWGDQRGLLFGQVVEFDDAANREGRQRISAPGSRIAAYVLKTDENLMIARHARALVGR